MEAKFSQETVLLTIVVDLDLVSSSTELSICPSDMCPAVVENVQYDVSNQ